MVIEYFVKDLWCGRYLSSVCIFRMMRRKSSVNLNAGFFLFSCIFPIESYGVFSFRFGVAADFVWGAWWCCCCCIFFLLACNLVVTIEPALFKIDVIFLFFFFFFNNLWIGVMTRGIVFVTCMCCFFKWFFIFRTLTKSYLLHNKISSSSSTDHTMFAFCLRTCPSHYDVLSLTIFDFFSHFFQEFSESHPIYCPNISYQSVFDQIQTLFW